MLSAVTIASEHICNMKCKCSANFNQYNPLCAVSCLHILAMFQTKNILILYGKLLDMPKCCRLKCNNFNSPP